MGEWPFSTNLVIEIYRTVELSCSGFSAISQYLGGVLMEDNQPIYSSKFQLFFGLTHCNRVRSGD